ncbi:DUF4138 domain-containing protein [Arenibacter certesii]|uniref:DUF4138 domain-containing protein n=1 Tax=Arenibacter certesii TaxID=228955 RepID=A0A918J6D1_9FLAO|nr:DUF4138 domain-containing protein [Arenibacter certesii]GGW50010.1 hypothetical protein GCM10007383_37400 [Arenibacter certesii]
MRIALLLISTILSGYLLSGQTFSDTLQISKDFKTILIFPENISESSIGNDFGFIVDLPKPEGGKYSGRILKLYYDELAIENENVTNYLVITDSGNVYDFLLELVAVPVKTTWYITQEMAVANIEGKTMKKGNEDVLQKIRTEPHFDEIQEKTSSSITIRQSKIKVEDSIDSATKELYQSDPLEYYRLRCYYMQFDKAKISRYFSRLDNVFLWLKGVYYNEDELYFQYRIENKEGLDMDVNFIKHQIATNYKNSSSNQKMELNPVFVYKQPKTVSGKSENHFVVVFKKFALDEKKEVLVELDEESGNRNLSLSIGHEIINNPIHF